jgi:ribokinase
MTTQDVVVVGSYVQDHCWITERFPRPGETRVGRFATGPGGKGFNQAVAARRIGARTLFVGALGRDHLAGNARRFATDESIECVWCELSEHGTAASSIVVDARGENQIVVDLGANLGLDPALVEGHTAAIAGARVVLCQFEIPIAATARALALGRAAGAIALLNPAPVAEPIAPEILAVAEIITPNETEFAALIEQRSGTRPRDDLWTLADAELHTLCRRLAVPTVAITLGARGAFVSHSDPARRKDREPCYRVPAPMVRAIDTTGAGDAFNGALAAMLALDAGIAFRDAVLTANRAAAISTETVGTAPAMATRAAVLARFGA